MSEQKRQIKKVIKIIEFHQINKINLRAFSVIFLFHFFENFINLKHSIDL